jgi:hypothetical protein
VDETSVSPEPLLQRLPRYGVIFGVGLAAGAAVGVVVWLATSTGLTDAMGYTYLALGTLLLLTGGARGGGYTNLGVGAVEALMGGRNRSQDDYVTDEELRRGHVMKKRDPMERLRRGLRPQANPTAFWQVIAGFLYIGVGLILTLFLAAG